MKIKLISSNINSGKKNLSRIAWELSRSPDDATPLDTILSIDAPVNEIPSVVLSIECTILEREIFASFRDHVMWARTSRVDAPENFEIPDYFNNIPDHVDAKNYLKDHRIFMSSVIAALTFGGEWHIHDKDSINTSFPNFLKILKEIQK